MTISTDDAEYLHGRAAMARDLLNQSRDQTIRQALADIATSYETMARRAERLKGVAKPTRLLVLLLIAFPCVADLANAIALT